MAHADAAPLELAALLPPELSALPLLGSGALSEVRLLAGRDGLPPLALKATRKRLLAFTQQIDRLVAEHRVLQQTCTECPDSLARFVGAAHDDERVYLFSEAVLAQSACSVDLRQLLRASVPPETISGAAVARVAECLFGALRHLHSRRFAHRDVKPDNLVISSAGTVACLCRFRPQCASRLDRLGSVVGSVVLLGDFARASHAAPSTIAARRSTPVACDHTEPVLRREHARKDPCARKDARSRHPPGEALPAYASAQVLVDLGHAAALPSDGGPLRSLVGTEVYMAPELLGRKGHGCAVDCWAAGATLFELFTGEPPFSADECTGWLGRAQPSAQERVAERVRRQPLSVDAESVGVELLPEARASLGGLGGAAELLERLLVVDAAARTDASSAAEHPWLRAGEGGAASLLDAAARAQERVGREGTPEDDEEAAWAAAEAEEVSAQAEALWRRNHEKWRPAFEPFGTQVAGCQ